MTFKLIVFDKDGTLLDCDAYWQEAIRLQLAGLKARGVDGETIQWCRKSMGIYPDNTLDPDGPWVLASTLEEKIVLAVCLYQRLGWQWDRIRELLEDVYSEVEDNLSLDKFSVALPGVPQALQALTEWGYILAVATTDTQRKSEEMLAKAGIAHYFAGIVGSDLVERGKPSPDMLELLAATHGVKPTEVVMVGDGLPDVEMALNFGALPVAVLTGAGREQALKEKTPHVFSSVPQFVQWFLHK